MTADRGITERVRSPTGLHIGPILASPLLPLLVTLILYWPTLSQPYFWDDVVHFQFATTRTLGQIWTDVRGLSYYRPVTFTLYKLLFGLSAPGSSQLPHAFILLVHAANGWLVGCLVRRLLAGDGGDTGRVLGLRANDAAGLIASLLFVSYPFAVLPVSHFAAVMHPLVTLFTLGAAVAALEFVRSRQKRWLPVALGLALLAPFVHEAGVMAGIVVASVLVLHDRALAWRNRLLLLLLPCASALFLPAWLIVPKTPNTFQWIGWGGVLASVTFFLQGPTFPVQPLSRLLIERLARSDMGLPRTVVGLPWWVLGAIWLIAFFALLLAGSLLWRHRRLRFLGIALAWAFLTALPSIAVLPFPYVSVSQRLLYYGGPAAAVLWAAVCVSIAARPLARGAITLGLAGIIAVVPVLYIQREIDLHELALRPLEQLAAAGRQYPTSQHLVVNPVNWVNYRQPWYALGQEGVSVSADYVDFEQLVRLNAGTDVGFSATTFPPIRTELEHHSYSTINEETPWDWADVAAQAPAYDRIWLTTYSDERIAVEEAGWVRLGPDAPPADYLATFEDRIFLVAGALDVQDDGTAVATLDWQVLGGIPNATIFRHLSDCGGNLSGQGDGFALGRMLTFESLAPGTTVHDVRLIPLDAVSGDGCYRLGVGLYLPDGARVMARSPSGDLFENSVVTVTPR